MNADIKSNILNIAIELFNTNGYGAVTMRDIAGALHISPGNLTYHFKKKDDLIHAIVHRQCQDHENRHYRPAMSFTDLDDLMRVNMQHQKKYFFYFNNFTELRRKYPEIAAIQAKFKKQFFALLQTSFENFIEQGLMKPEPFPGVYDDLIYTILSVAFVWTQETSDRVDFVDSSKDYLSVLWNVLLPSLTEKGVQMIPRQDD